MTKTLFALDIGTRSVVGIILKEDGDTYHVTDLVSIEHKERSMIDGQIHNILSVANVIKEIKETLEVKHGPLTKVSVAAAGRALKTVEGTMSIDISEGSLFSTEDVNLLELAAVQKAQAELLSNRTASQKTNYYCVGYSVLHYKLDDEQIGSLIDQNGISASVDVIATFLPQVVIESLLAALKRAELEMEALTLEPIAAIQVLIPPSMRRLNVALVDIGAGTSDIAITDNNTVIAYGMVPIAGDEVTETLSSEYLLDFPLAEKLKRQLSVQSEVIIEDILGFEEIIPSDKVNETIHPTIDRLARSIADEVLRLNGGKSPKAVILVGGGSLTPNLPQLLCTYLELPKNRVAIRGLEALSGVTTDPAIASSPDLITPIGIAIAARKAPIHYMPVTVNNREFRLFKLKNMTIADALIASNIPARQLYGKPGHGMTITVNGQDIIVPGEHGTASTLLLNGSVASSKDIIKSGDAIELISGQNGADAKATPQDLFEDLKPIHVTVDNTEITLHPKILINQIEQSMTTEIQDRDKIVLSNNNTLEAVLMQMQHSILNSGNRFIVTIDGKQITLKGQETVFYNGNESVKLQQTLGDGDRITFKVPALPTIEEVVTQVGQKLADQITVLFNGKETTIRKERLKVRLNGKYVNESAIVNPNDHLEFISLNNDQIVFSDIFAFTDYNLPTDQSGKYQLLRNDNTIGFNDPIFGGDNLKIQFSTIISE